MTKHVLCITPNPVLDLTLATPTQVMLEGRGTILAETAGGKGVNVARFISGLGGTALASGFVGGWTGTRLLELLDSAGVAHDMIPIAGNTRYSVNLVDPSTGRRERSLDFDGPHVSDVEVTRLIDTVANTVTEKITWVVIAGSTPPGFDSSRVPDLLRACGPAHVILDAEGAVLQQGLTCSPYLVKINRHELASAGYPDATHSANATRDAMSDIRHRFGVREVWVTLGSGGAMMQTDEGTLRTSINPLDQALNSLSAGDCFLAAMLVARTSGLPLDEQARQATAQATASVSLSIPELASPEQ
jgi:1-phosphofructokinase family hexose kinase